MSLVGPRPLLMEYLPLYSPEQARRHEVRPGITGWAQVNGRNAVSWDEKFALDVWYVDHRSTRLDSRSCGRPSPQVVSGHGVSAAGHATMEPFRGSRRRSGRRSVSRVIVIGGADQGRQVIDAIVARGHPRGGRRARPLVPRAATWSPAFPCSAPTHDLARRRGRDRGRPASSSPSATTPRAARSSSASRAPAAHLHPAIDRAPGGDRRATTPPSVRASILLAGAVVGNGSRIGRGVLLGINSSVDHDGWVDDHASLAPDATTGGTVRIGRATAIGLGANVIHGVTIGGRHRGGRRGRGARRPPRPGGGLRRARPGGPGPGTRRAVPPAALTPR